MAFSLWDAQRVPIQTDSGSNPVREFKDEANKSIFQPQTSQS